jgi:hypothetical protein
MYDWISAIIIVSSMFTASWLGQLIGYYRGRTSVLREWSEWLEREHPEAGIPATD